MLKKVVSIFAVIVILVTSLPIIPISEAVNEVVVSQIQKIAAIQPTSNVTTYDVTGLTAGADAGHQHIYEGKFDENSHWQECWICGNIIDRVPHEYTRTGRDVCNSGEAAMVDSCSCGYSKTLPKKLHVVAKGKYAIDTTRFYHDEYCANCDECLTAERCRNAQGQLIGCDTGIYDVCAICGFDYSISNGKHAIIDASDTGNKGICRTCGKEFISWKVSKQVLDETSTRFLWEITPIAEGININTDITKIAFGSCDTPNIQPVVTNQSCWQSNGKIFIQADFTAPAIDENGISSGTIPYSVHVHAPEINFGNLAGIHLETKWADPEVTLSQDNFKPTKNSNIIDGNGNVNNYSRQAKIIANYTDTWQSKNNIVYMRLMDGDKNTTISDWTIAEKNGTIYTHTFDVVAEIREASNVYVQVKDACGNITNLEDGAVNVQYIDAVAPRLIGGQATQTNWSKTKTHTYTTEDKGVGDVQIAFNSQNEFALAEKNGDIYTRTYNFTGDVTGNVTAALYIKDALGNIRTERVTISNLDNTAPTIDTVNQTLSTDKQSVGIQLTASDYCKRINANGSGVAKYAISKTQQQPDASQFQQESSFTVTENGTYYLWAMDAVGNISEPKQILIKDIEININGTIAWNDQNDKYHTRKQTTLNLYRKVGSGAEELAGSATVEAGQTEYSFKVRETNDQGQKYTYRVEEGNITGYKTTVSGYNITNDLIIPAYTSEITYTAVDTYNNQYLKNGKVRIKGIVQNTNNETYPELGVNGTITFVIDNAIALEEGTLTINKVSKTGAKTLITSYSKSGNTITITNETIKAEEKIEIEVVGKASQIKTYTSTINLRGKLRAYNGKNTNIDLGELTKAEKQIEVTKLVLR